MLIGRSAYLILEGRSAFPSVKSLLLFRAVPANYPYYNPAPALAPAPAPASSPAPSSAPTPASVPAPGSAPASAPM